MKYFIYRLHRVSGGIVEIKDVSEQPNGGFDTMEKAEFYLVNCLRNKNSWVFQQEYEFTILSVYQ